MNDNHRGDDIEARARRRVGLKLGFFAHATIYVLVNLGLFAINAVRGGEHWAIWPLAGWGLGLAIHGIVTFVKLRGEGFGQRMLDAEIERLRRKG